MQSLVPLWHVAVRRNGPNALRQGHSTLPIPDSGVDRVLTVVKGTGGSKLLLYCKKLNYICRGGHSGTREEKAAKDGTSSAFVTYIFRCSDH